LEQLQQSPTQLLQQQQQQHGDSPDLSSPSDGEAPGATDDSSNSNRLPESPEGPDIVKVSHRSRVSSVAGKIAHDVRDGRLPRIMVAGNPSISVATKAIVQARRYLRPEGQDIAFAPLFRSSDHSRALLELAVVLMPLERGTAANNLAQLDNAGGHEVRIASSSRHARVGSATARQLRARGINVLCSVGQEALANSVMATAHAACYLNDVGRQMVVQPSHVVLQRGSQELHSFKLVAMFA
jgi:stage V sporulation protein SpoVS